MNVKSGVQLLPLVALNFFKCLVFLLTKIETQRDQSIILTAHSYTQSVYAKGPLTINILAAKR